MSMYNEDNQFNRMNKRIVELEKEKAWLQDQHVRVCSSESKLREENKRLIGKHQEEIFNAVQQNERAMVKSNRYLNKRIDTLEAEKSKAWETCQLAVERGMKLEAELKVHLENLNDQDALIAKLREALASIANRQGYWTPDQTVARKALMEGKEDE